VLCDGQPPHDVEADADTAEPAAVAGLALHEALEDPLVVARGDPDTLVLDVHLDRRTDAAGAHGDGPARGRVLERVL
jgi:hypothetical protein